MICVVQRVRRAAVHVAGTTVGQIGRGLACLTAIERGDGEAQAHWMAHKLASLRIFPDEGGQKPYDRDVRQIGGAALLVSNFTVAASCAKGRRPSLEAAAAPHEAAPLFERLVTLLREAGVTVETGHFGAMMDVELVNEGPVTFLLQTLR